MEISGPEDKIILIRSKNNNYRSGNFLFCYSLESINVSRNRRNRKAGKFEQTRLFEK
jgi:hypothetical protein